MRPRSPKGLIITTQPDSVLILRKCFRLLDELLVIEIGANLGFIGNGKLRLAMDFALPARQNGTQ